MIDGDTIELSGGQRVRYLGIDAPEIRRREGDRWVVDPEPYGEAAREANRALVEGKSLRLAHDVQTHDRFGRFLAYVYTTGDGAAEVMVNEELLRLGMAQLLTIPPNVKYVERFRRAAKEARVEGRGLWSSR